MEYITGNTGKWEYVIGLEVHAQVISESKLFSGSSTKYGAEPNSQVSLIDAAMPGMLPVLNMQCVKQAIKTGLGINGVINKVSAFDRKNYFYPDLPQGYQISQFFKPIVENGHLMITTENGQKKIRINRIHLEQDAGKSMHDQSPEFTLIDLNRSGIALMEIVSEPDLRSPEEAAEFLKKLRSLVRYIGSCDGNMDQGSMRCDANVSVRRAGEEFGTRCEIKNVNSIRNVMRAIEHEGLRQVELLESGGKVLQETRLFDANNGTTRAMRTKEDAVDYRYFPDPDLLPLEVSDELIEEMRQELPELPDAKVKRYTEQMGLSQYDAEVIVADEETARYFEQAAGKANPKMLANWIAVELFGKLNKAGLSLADCKVTPELLAGLVGLIEDGTISGKIAKTVFEEMFDSGSAPQQIVEEKGLVQIADAGELEQLAKDVMAENEDSVAAYRAGKTKLLGFFVGQVMKKSGGKANPPMVNKILKELLEDKALD